MEVRALGPLPVKGLEGPLEVYELLRAATVRSRFQAGAARGLTKFVGRDSELEQIGQALERARAGHGQVVAVVGEPGVGKSRLYWEFTRSHRARDWLVLESASVSYGKASAYLPVIELLRGYFQIEAGDETRKIREKVTGKVLSLDRALEPWLAAFLSLLDVPAEDPGWNRLEPGQRRQRTLDGVKRLLLRESQVQPLLVLFEDLHWIDAETQAFLESLIESLPTARLLLLVNYRPEYAHGWGSKTYYRQLQIAPLPPESADALLDDLLGTAPTLAPLKRLVIERSEGNPFFMEETVRSLVETGVLAGARGAYRPTGPVRGLQVPATAQAMVAARIDRLTPEDKRLLQTAAVIGTDVPLALLQAIAEEPEERLRGGLGRLQATEFLYETRLFPEIEYAFKHALTHEVAYGSLLAERRRALHARIVEAIEALYTDRLDEHVDRLARHALRGELGDRAVPHLRRAGLRAAARSALKDARAWFEQALGILEGLPEDRAALEQAFDTRLELLSVLSMIDELRLALGHLRAAEGVAQRLTDDRRRGRALAFLARVHLTMGALDEAMEAGTSAAEIARGLGDPELWFLARSALGATYYLRAEFDEAVRLATENLAAFPPLQAGASPGDPRLAEMLVTNRSFLIRSLSELGRFAEAAPHEAEAIRLAESAQHPFAIGLLYYGAGALHLGKGDWAKARSLLEQSVAAFRAGNVAWRVHVTCSAWVLAQLGETSEALDRLRDGEQLVERFAATGHGAYNAWAYHGLGRACLLLGRLDEARAWGERAVEADPAHPGFGAHAEHLLGDIATHPDRFDPERAETQYRQALALAEPRGMRPLVAHCHLGLGRLHRRTGARERAAEHLTTAVALYREMDMPFWLEQAEAELREVG